MKILVLYNDTAGKSEAKETAEKFQAYVKEQGEEHQAFLQASNPDVDPKETFERLPKNTQSIRL